MCGSIRTSGCGCTGGGRRGRRGNHRCIEVGLPASARRLPSPRPVCSSSPDSKFDSMISGRVPSGRIEIVMDTFEQIAERERQYLLQTYNRYPIVLTRGKGVFLWDIDEKRFLDFVSGLGVNALGHAHPRIVKAIREQAAKLIHVSNPYYHQYQGPLAEKLCTLSGLNRAFFSNSGTEAIEGSIKLARLAGHRAGGEAKCRLVALEGSYHGRTFGALSLTGQAKHT